MDENLIKKIVDCVIRELMSFQGIPIFDVNIQMRKWIDNAVRKTVAEHNSIYMPNFNSEESDTDNPNYNEAGVSMADYGN